MSDADQTRQDWQQRVEQRINDLEAENEKLKASSETQQESGLPVTRRQALGGLLGGGALLGAAGSASAQPPSGPGGPPFANEDHDHSGDYLGEGEPVDRIDSARVNATDELNNVEIVRPGDDIQAAIDSVYEPGDLPERRAQAEGNYSGMVRFLPNHPDNQLIYEFPDPPYVVRPGVTLDMRGIVAELTADAKALFDLRYAAKVLGHGAYINDGREESIFTGACWYVSGGSEPWDGSSMRNPVMVLGFPTLDVVGLENQQAGTKPVLLEQTDGTSIGGCRFEVTCGNTKGLVKIKSTQAGGWVNHNTVIGRGAVAGGNAVEYIAESGDIYNNYVWIDHMQVRPPVNRFLYCDAGPSGRIFRNYTGGVLADLGRNISGPVAEWTEGVGYANPLSIVSDYVANINETGDSPAAAIDNSGARGNRVGNPYRASSGVYDLSETTGFVDGEIKPDDGSNTAHRGVLCCWDNVAQNWVRPDGSMIQSPDTPDRSTGGRGEGDTKTYSIEKNSLSIDGDVGDLANVANLSVVDDFRVYAGDPSVSGPVWLTWDSSNLYLAADLTDNVHSQPHTVGRLYSGDCIQLGVAEGVPAEGTKFAEFTIALNSSGAHVVKRVIPGGGSLETLDTPAEIVRNDQTNSTIYEIAIPWSEVPTKPSEDSFGASMTVADFDQNNTRSGLLEWGGGIYGGKNASAFNIVKLTDN